MDVKVISRSSAEYSRARACDIRKVYRNPDAKLHPFEQAREYTRALNAAKLSRVFAKPFLGQLQGHRDAVYSLSGVGGSLTSTLSGACDGELRCWNLTTRKCEWSVQAHEGFVRGVTTSPDGAYAISCGVDKTVKVWEMASVDAVTSESSTGRRSHLSSTNRVSDDNAKEPVYVGLSEHAFTSVTHHQHKPIFCTSGESVDVWDVNHSEPVWSFSWGADTIHTVRFNPVEVNVIASTASDRNVVLYDVRQHTPIKKMIMNMSSNALAWNPMEAFHFTLANEDHNCYTFDMRRLEKALVVHEDHVAAVMQLDYSPTGKEFVTGSYDRTIRIFQADQGRSREVYHTSRMQRVFAVQYSRDNNYILSGSDDGNIRLWKARASESLTAANPRERRSQNYKQKLTGRFKHAPDVKRILKQRHVPKQILSAQRLKHTIKVSKRRKRDNVASHSKPESVVHKNAKKKKVVSVE